MLAQELHQTGSLWSFLLSVDKDLAECARRDGCSCGGRLHCADYPRAPRCGLDQLSDECRYRFSFCCDRDGCRKRVTPPSVRFRQEGLPWCRRHPGQRDAAGASTATGSRAFKPIRR
jgi:hypothetical protein